MKRIVLALFAFTAAAVAQQKQPVSSLQEDCGVTFQFTAQSSGVQAAGTVQAGSTGTTAVIDNTTAGCLDWLVTYSTTSTVTGISLHFQTASNVAGVPGTWADYPGTLTSGINPNTAATSPWAFTEATGPKFPFLRMNLTSLTGTGTVQGKLYGWKRRPTYVTVTAGGGCPGTIATPCVVVGPTAAGSPPTTSPVLVAGQDGAPGNIRVIETDSSGRQIAVGAAASGAAKAGSPVQIGGVFNTTQPTVTTGQAVEAQYSARGTALVTPGVEGFPVVGTKTTNAAAPGTNNLGVLPGIANAAAPTYTEGFLALLSMDLTGALRTTGAVTQTATSTALADGASNTQPLPTASGAAVSQRTFGTKFNGSTWDKDFVCTNQARTLLTNATRTELIPLSGSTIIRVCHIHMTTTAAEDFTISYGTGSACGTGTTTIDKYLSVQAIAMDFQPTAALRAIAANALCVTQTGTQNAEVTVIYAQY